MERKIRDDSYLRWFLEVTNQEYKGKVADFFEATQRYKVKGF